MKVAVLGAGVIGVTSAWYLARAGHEVVVIDRQAGPALETSFANAGELSFGFCSPWAAPGVPLKALKWLFAADAPLVLRPKPDLAMLSWLARMVRNCNAPAYRRNKSRMLRLSDYSRLALAEVRRETNIVYDQRMKGTLQLFRTGGQVEASGKDVEALAADGIAFEVLDREACLRVEPALVRATAPIAGGLLTPNDETGDCFKFTAALAELCSSRGVAFEWGRTVRRIETENGRATGVGTDRGRVAADAVVVALGSWSPRLLAPLGLAPPVYPVKGYSLTIPIVDASRAPESTVMDETYKIAITRLGERIRVGGTAEISGFTRDLPEKRRRTLERSVTDLFPGGDLARAAFWSGLRPMTPDGTPVIGGTGVEGLFLNTGHGTLGWTMSCGSAKLLADLVSSRAADIDARDLSLARYG